MDDRLFVQRIRRGADILEARPELELMASDVVAVSGRRETLVSMVGVRAEEVEDRELLDIPISSADVMLTNRDLIGRTIDEVAE